jgi:predicted DNA-binding protein (UPF0251 family)
VRTPYSVEHYARVERERIPGEPLFEAIVRILVEDTLAATEGSITRAANLTGASRTTIRRHIDKAKLKVVNAKLGRSDLNRSQRGIAAAETKARRQYDTNLNISVALAQMAPIDREPQ